MRNRKKMSLMIVPVLSHPQDHIAGGRELALPRELNEQIHRYNCAVLAAYLHRLQRDQRSEPSVGR